MLKKIKEILTGKRPLVDIWHYILGNLRYKAYYKQFGIRYKRPIRWLIRKHILEQIQYRIRFMDRECYEQGSCKICGCETTALQMANKPCDKPCYPAMMNKEQWELFNRGTAFRDKNGLWIQEPFTKKPTLLKETNYAHYV